MPLVHDDVFRKELTCKAAQDAGRRFVFHGRLENAFDVYRVWKRPKGASVMEALCSHLQEKAPDGSLVMRHAVDQFYVIIPALSGEDTEKIAALLQAAVKSFADEKMQEPAHIGVTLGAAVLRKDGNPEEAFYRAFAALRHAEKTGTSFHSFDQDCFDLEEGAKLQITAGYVRRAMEEKRLRFAYQPIVESKSSEVYYYECLLRLVERDYTILPAGLFIPVAERLGFIDQLDKVVFGLALEELYNYPEVRLAVNISTEGIRRRAYEDLLESLRKNRSMAQRLVIEVTESGDRRDIERIGSVMSAFRETGCGVALDDFGVGHTSFTQLLKLPLDVIKIDGKFVRNLFNAPENRMLVETVVNFGRHFGKKTVAEFVESRELAERLAEMQVDYLQGNYFSPASNNRLWLETPSVPKIMPAAPEITALSTGTNG